MGLRGNVPAHRLPARADESKSREAIVAFAGENMDKAVYYPEDREFLREITPELVHYEVAVAEKIEFRG